MAADDRLTLLRPADAARALGVSAVTLWRWSRDPAMQFPKAFRLGRNSIAYDEAEVRRWLETRRVSHHDVG
jgi:predicted DNA-binding transcriptional regulator AlpA